MNKLGNLDYQSSLWMFVRKDRGEEWIRYGEIIILELLIAV